MKYFIVVVGSTDISRGSDHDVRVSNKVNLKKAILGESFIGRYIKKNIFIIVNHFFKK